MVEWDGQSSAPTSLKTIATVEDDRPTNRLNDGKCDPRGRLWTGMQCELYRVIMVKL